MMLARHDQRLGLWRGQLDWPGLGYRRGGGAAPFNPASLFADGQAGHWAGGYDPAAGRMWRDASGTVPVLAETGQPVGMVLDMSQGAVSGSELITNGDFAGGATGWNLSAGMSISAGKLTMTGAGSGSQAWQAYVGSGTFEVTIVVDSLSEGAIQPWLHGASASVSNISAPGTYVQRITGVGISRLALRMIGATTAVVSSVSFRLVAGAHAVQATALSRPTLGRWPKGGRRNVLTWTEGFTNPAWTPTNAIPSTGIIAEDNELSGHYLRQTLNSPFAVGVPGTASIEVKEGTARYAQVCLTGGNRYRAVAIDLRTGATDSRQPATMSPMPPEVVTPLEDGWFRLSFSAAPLSSGTLSSLQVSVLPDLHETAPGTGGVVTYQGSGKNILIRNAQCELGTVATPYQRVTTANDITEAGVPAVWHLWDDGGDSLPVTLPSGTYGRARVNTDGGVTVDTVTDPVGVMSGTRQVDVILRQGAFSPDEEAAIRAYWARYQP